MKISSRWSSVTFPSCERQSDREQDALSFVQWKRKARANVKGFDFSEGYKGRLIQMEGACEDEDHEGDKLIWSTHSTGNEIVNMLSPPVTCGLWPCLIGAVLSFSSQKASWSSVSNLLVTIPYLKQLGIKILLFSKQLTNCLNVVYYLTTL